MSHGSRFVMIVLAASTAWLAGCAGDGTGGAGAPPDARAGAPDGGAAEDGDVLAPDALPGVVDLAINEVFAGGDPSAAFPTDWIEIVNRGDQAVDLAGYHLSDDEADLEKGTFPDGTTIAAGGYLVVEIADVEPFAFGLRASGETVLLSDAEGAILDQTTWPADGAGSDVLAQSWGRAPDATGAFVTLEVPTPDAANPAE